MLKELKSKIIAGIIMIFTALNILNGIYEPFKNYNLIEIPVNYTIYLFPVLFIIIIILLKYYKFWILINENEKNYIAILSTINKLKKQVKLLKNSNFLFSDNKYKLIIVKWRLETELNKFKQIFTDRWIVGCLPKYEFLRYFFGSIICSLTEEDTYLTVSTLLFWVKDKKNSGLNFLKLNIEAIKIKKVNLHRVILIPSLQNNIDKKSILELKAFASELLPFKDDLEDFYFVESDDYENEANYPIPYAIIHNCKKNNFMFLLPRIHDTRNDEHPTIEVLFASNVENNEVKFLYRNYQDFIKSKKDKFISIEKLNKLLANI